MTGPVREDRQTHVVPAAPVAALPPDPPDWPAQFAALYPFAFDPFQQQAIAVLAGGGSVMVAAPTGVGKALAADTPVLTPTGWTAIGALRPGDPVIGAQGRPVTVTAVYPQGIRPAYRVTFADQVSIICDLDHLWAVNTKSRRHYGLPWRVLSLRQILAEGLTDGQGRRHFVPLVRPVAFERIEEVAGEAETLAVARQRTGLTQRALATRTGIPQPTIAAWETGRNRISVPWRERLAEAIQAAGPRPPLDPYLLGCLLGDGGLSTSTIRFSSADADLLDALRQLLPPDVTMIPANGGRPYDWLMVSRHRRCRNPVIDALRELGLLGHQAEGKFVPRAYKFAPIDDRIALLQGLLDTDGSVSRQGKVEYMTVSRALAEDVAFLVRSCGGRTRIITKQTGFQMAYRLHIKLPDEIVPFRLRRKAERYAASPRKQPSRAITSVEPAGEAEMVCIAVDVPDGLFVIDGFVVTHNTVVAEYAIYRAYRASGRIMYTTPIKALSNQKFADLRARYGEAVGLLTGDVSENPGARIIVMTTEILRNMLMQSPWELNDVACVVFDEIHYLADPERGTTWEESIILCPEHIQLVCLSATVSNADEIAAWISRTHRPIQLITHLERAVPLSLYYYLDGQLQLVRDRAGRMVADFGRVGGEARARLGERGRGRGRPGSPAEGERPEPGVVEIVGSLDRAEMLPAIYFLFSRRDCEAAADQAMLMKLQVVRDRTRLERIDEVLARHLAPLRPADLRLGQVQAITRLARRGLGYHHAGLLPPLKRLVEDLFTQGLMGVVFATDTLALGVNMPARTVVVGRMVKYDGVQRRLLLPNEFQQMAGRAGRRGLDPEGFVVIPYSPWISFRDGLAVATGPLLPVLSAFVIRYNSVLNLWDPPRGSRVRMLLHKSLHEFQTDTRVRELEAEALQVRRAMEALPAGCPVGHPDSHEPLHDYESLGRTLATARDLVRRLERERAALDAELERTPWTPPSREALRRAFRHLPPGVPLHHEREGWGLYLGPGGAGPGFALFGRRAMPIGEYRSIDYLLPEPTPVPLPPALRQLTEPAADVLALLSTAEQTALLAAVAALELPDLAAWRSEFRAERRRELDRDFRRNDRALAEARANAEALLVEREGHVCHGCPVRKDQQRVVRHRYELEREHEQAEERWRRQIRREQERVDRVVGAIAGVLHHFGYLERGNLTAKADMLAGIYDPNGLILCEAIDRGWFDGLEPDDLAEVCSWFAFDRDTKFGNHYLLPHQLLQLRRDLEELQYEVFAQERRGELAISTGYHRAFYGVARAWCRGAELTEIAEVVELSEGDLVTTLNKTLDLMRQLREMLVEVAPTAPLRHTVDWAIKLVARDIVAQSYQLAFVLPPGEPDGAPSAAP